MYLLHVQCHRIGVTPAPTSKLLLPASENENSASSIFIFYQDRKIKKKIKTVNYHRHGARPKVLSCHRQL